jgi:polysaccharide export outer membrane protein
VAAQQPQSATSANLLIGPGDLLTVEVLGLEDLSRKVRVGTEGTIRMPLVGELEVAGLKPGDIESLIAATLRSR